MSARVIILNGVSSAGKSSLAKAIQQLSGRTLLNVEMDAFISFLPSGHELKPDWFKLDMIRAEDGSKVAKISNGPRGAALLKVMRGFVVEAANNGLDLVVDEVCEAAEVNDYRAGLRGCDLHLVKVDAPIEVIEAREKERGDRLLGLARGQSTGLHNGIAYDAEIDTTTGTPDELAERLLREIGA